MKKNITEIKKILLKQYPPEHFTSKTILAAFIGAMIMGLTFIFKGLLFQVSLGLTTPHLILIIAITLTILTAEIYYIGYARVENKKQRPFFQFWTKRIFAFYVISIIVAFLLVYLYGIDIMAGSFFNTIRVVIAVSMPCAIGTSLSDLLKS